MILTPPGFLPDQHARADDDAIAHVFLRDRLLQPADAPALLPWAAYLELGFSAARTHVIGRQDGVTHLAVALAEEALELEFLKGQWPNSLDQRLLFGDVRSTTPILAPPPSPICNAGVRPPRLRPSTSITAVRYGRTRSSPRT